MVTVKGEKLTAIVREGFEYGENGTYFQTVSSGILSQCCTWLFTLKVSEIVVSRKHSMGHVLFFE